MHECIGTHQQLELVEVFVLAIGVLERLCKHETRLEEEDLRTTYEHVRKRGNLNQD